MDLEMIKFFYPTSTKVATSIILCVTLSCLALVETMAYHTEARPVHAGVKGQRAYALLLNPLLFPLSYLVGNGETVYTTYDGKVVFPEGFNAASIVLQNFLLHLPFYLILSYIIPCVIVFLLEVKKGK